MSDDWIDTLKEKAREIESIAQWASIVGYGNVRDQLRIARAKIMEKIEFREELLARSAQMTRAGR